jgi:PKD repeat protein
MKKLFLFTLVVTVLALVSAAGVYAAASAKVNICHIPPGNPDNWHTITVSENALSAHLAHGDLPGRCEENLEKLCNDGNACTIDVDYGSGTCYVNRPPVDCDDGNFCTTNTCDPVNGCQSAPIVCSDGDLCTIDACNPFDGQCAFTPKDCGALGVCLAGTGQCDYPCEGITCDPIDQCHTAGECILPGQCVNGAPLADGTACVDGNAATANDQCTGGVCAGAPSCTADFTFTPETGIAPLFVSFSGLSSSSPNGPITNYAWDYGDGATDTGAEVGHYYFTSGSYNVLLTVTDNLGFTCTKTSTIVVNKNQLPICSFIYQIDTSTGALILNVNASGSTDPYGTIVAYYWGWGDGKPSSTGIMASHIYTSPGEYTVTLVAVDNLDGQCSISQNVLVQAPALP